MLELPVGFCEPDVMPCREYDLTSGMYQKNSFSDLAK
jgi:hypothetical protein